MGRTRVVLFGLAVVLSPWLCVSARGEDSPLASDERVVFFDTFARLDPTGEHWVAEIHGWVHELESARIRKKGLSEFLKKKYGLRSTVSTRKNFDRRASLIFADNERGKAVPVVLAGATYSSPESEPNGHFRSRVQIPVTASRMKAVNGTLTLEARLGPEDPRRFAGTIYLVPPVGVSVISDIDDTVKVTHATNRGRLMDSTFYQKFSAAPGMPELYRRFAAHGAQFHYVSSSPWQLHEPLVESFADAGLPRGSMHLKSVRFKDRTVTNLFKKGTETKPAQIEPLLQAFPKRRFILVGDSGEEDPEVYGAMARRYPAQILAIFIRRVPDSKTTAARFARAFAGVPADKWFVFKDPGKVRWPGDRSRDRGQ